MGQEDEVIEQTGEAEIQNSEEVIEENPIDTGETVIDGEEPQPAEPAFVPDYKFRANQQDMEIPEEFRAHIKDVDSQKKIKDIFEKYHGFDTQKTKVSALEADVTKYRGSYEGVVNKFQDIQKEYAHAIQSGNLHNLDHVFTKLGLTEDVLMAWAGEKAKLASLDDTQRAAVLQRNKLERDMFVQQNEQQSLMTENQQKDAQILRMQFDSAMATPQVQSFEKELDGKFGKEGLFREEVQRAGELAWLSQKKTLTVAEAMQAVINKFGLTGVAPAATLVPAGGAQPQGGGQGQANGQQQGGAGAGNVDAQGRKIIQRETKTIPNVGSAGGASPIGQPKAKNLDDVRARYKELAAQG